jgi:putative oxidoreductase
MHATPRPAASGLAAIPWAPRVWRTARAASEALGFGQAPALLAARLYVGAVFFRSGLTKLRDWDTTLALFQDEYQVPLLDPALAAWAGTAGELVLPVLLVAGLGGRLAALGLTVVNIVAVLSLPELPDAAWQGHLFWGSLLLAVVVWGPGAWSLDHPLARWIDRRLGRSAPR